jgi:hypothetical protein
MLHLQEYWAVESDLRQLLVDLVHELQITWQHLSRIVCTILGSIIQQGT